MYVTFNQLMVLEKQTFLKIDHLCCPGNQSNLTKIAIANVNNNCLTRSLFKVLQICFSLLAHLSRRLIGELIGYSWSGVRPSASVVRRPQCSKIFFSETAGPIKVKFYVEPPWVGGTKFCSRHPGHMTTMAATPTYGKNPSKIFFSGNWQADFHETWYVASGTPAHHSLFKWWPWSDLDLFYGTVKFGFYRKKWKLLIFQNICSLWP